MNAGTLALDYGTQENSKLADAAVLTLSGAAVTLAGGTHEEVVGSTAIDGAVSVSP